RSISDIIDLSSTTDSNTSGPNIDTADNSDSGEASNSTELTTPEPTYLPNTRSRPSTRLKQPVPRLADASILPDLSDNLDNDIDEDITNDNLVEALREVTPNNKGFRGYYRRIIRTRITAEDSEEINTIRANLALSLQYTRSTIYVSLYKIIRTGALPNNFPFPKIINDPSLIFSPYIFIFALSLQSPYAFLYRAPSKAIRLR
ncbi:hypothetical protein N7516_009938, partial [Penicillium verrucosum]|uniref:uncharacterized protein n=1 Tax=Penicillium verrucosum TaxID=60171 RepID=UPI002545594B